MGRPLVGRLRVRGWLELLGPLHVGGLGVDPDVDLTLAVDGQGRPVVPGTSLAGPLRAWTERTNPQPWREVWGSATRDGRASTVYVDDGHVFNSVADATDGAPTAVREEVRDGVGIDRVTGSAARRVLYRRAILPRGAVVGLSLVIESPNAVRLGSDRKALGHLLADLAAGRVRIGAGKTRGLGKVRLLTAPHLLSVTETSLASPQATLATLVSPRPLDIAGLLSDASASANAGKGPMTITVSWSAASPVMVRSGADGFFVDALPLVSRVKGADEVVPVLPGSSIKGALRSRSELIARTVLGVDAPTGPAKTRFADQLGQIDLVSVLFGAAPPTDDTSTLGLGAVGVDDCYASATKPLTTAEWAAVVTPGPAAGADASGDRARMPQAIAASLAASGLTERAHVAIDRWTGGAASGRLFSVLETAQVAWDDLTITVDLDRVPAELRDASLALLVLLLRDLKGGGVKLGYATNRGMGDIEVTAVTLAASPWGDLEIDDLGSDDLAPLNAAWREWGQW